MASWLPAAVLLLLLGPAVVHCLDLVSPITGLRVAEPPNCYNLNDRNGNSWRHMLYAHNVARARHNSPPLVWNWTLADAAQAFVDRSMKNANSMLAAGKGIQSCVVNHDLADIRLIPRVTENMDWSGRVGSCSSSVDFWYSEIRNWKFTTDPDKDNDRKTSPGEWGHWFNVISRYMVEVGCGSASAVPTDGITCGITVCRYRYTTPSVDGASRDPADWLTLTLAWPPLDDPPPDPVLPMVPNVLSTCADDPRSRCSDAAKTCGVSAQVAYGDCPKTCGTCTTPKDAKPVPDLPPPPPPSSSACVDVWPPACQLWAQVGACRGEGSFSSGLIAGLSIKYHWCRKTCGTCAVPRPPPMPPSPPPLGCVDTMTDDSGSNCLWQRFSNGCNIYPEDRARERISGGKNVPRELCRATCATACTPAEPEVCEDTITRVGQPASACKDLLGFCPWNIIKFGDITARLCKKSCGYCAPPRPSPPPLPPSPPVVGPEEVRASPPPVVSSPPPVPVPRAGCERPSWWCTHNTSVLFSTDCDGDGLRDWTCADSFYGRWIIRSTKNCVSEAQVDESTCPAAFKVSLSASIPRCTRPDWWCIHATAQYQYLDCDGDNILDAVCTDAQRNRYVILSGRVPNTCYHIDFAAASTCTPAFGIFSGSELPSKTCALPKAWCQEPDTQLIKTNCNGDKVFDYVCLGDNGRRDVIASPDCSVVEDAPDSACPAVFGTGKPSPKGPPPGINFPPPDADGPPPGISYSPPDVDGPPPGISYSPPDVDGPPPGLNPPPPPKRRPPPSPRTRKPPRPPPVPPQPSA